MSVIVFLPTRQASEVIDLLRRSVVFVGPGLNVAQTSLWLACVMSLAVLDIGKYVDGFGNVVEPEIRYGDGAVRQVFVLSSRTVLVTNIWFSHPPPFKCTIKLRSEKSAALVASVEC